LIDAATTLVLTAEDAEGAEDRENTRIAWWTDGAQHRLRSKIILKMAVTNCFQQRARRADRGETLRILNKAGKGNPPVEGDELPADWQKGTRKKSVRSYKGRENNEKK